MAKFQAWAASANLPGAATSAEAISKQVTERAGEDPHPEVSSECPEASCGVIGATQWQPSPIAVPHLATFNCQTVKPPVRNPGEVNRRWTPEEVARCEQHAPEILDGLSCPMYLLEANTTALTLESKCLDQMVRIQEIVENPTGHHNTREGFELATAGHLWGLRKQYDEAHGENATEEWLKHGRDLAAVPTLAQIEPMRVEVECRPYEPALPGETPPPPVARCVEEGGQHPWEIGSYNE